MQLFASMVGSAVLNVRAFAIASPAVVFFCLIERYGPCYGTRPTLASQIKGVLFQVVSLSVGGAAVAILWRWLPSPAPLWPALAFPLAFLIGDFVHYWEHRLEHMVPALWRFHAVHHCTEDLSAASNFNHFMHNVFMTVIYGVPVGMLTRDPLGIPAVILCLYVEAAYVHSPARISIGPLRWLFNDNRVHRIHHSIEERHWNRNFGAFLTIWDWVFGTMSWPSNDQWPDTGIPGYREIGTVREFIARPFLARSVAATRETKPTRRVSGAGAA
jgi:sterol desaturase/sphingolipid hydroxylase (fatty acid hydroxylase superfamily)